MSSPRRALAALVVVLVAGAAWLALRGDDDDAAAGSSTTATTSEPAIDDPGEATTGSTEATAPSADGPAPDGVDRALAAQAIEAIQELFPTVRDTLDQQAYEDMVERTCAETRDGAAEDVTPEVVAEEIAAGVPPDASPEPQYEAAMLSLAQAYLQSGTCGADRAYERSVREALLPLASRAFTRDVGGTTG